jgi:hypothetical protein
MPFPVNTPIFPQLIMNWSTILVAANTSNLVNYIQAGNNGTKIESMIATSNNTVDLTLTLWINNGGADTALASILIAANSGRSAGVPSVDCLRSPQLPGLVSDPNGNKILYLANNAVGPIYSIIKVSVNTNIQAAAALGIFAYGGNY